MNALLTENSLEAKLRRRYDLLRRTVVRTLQPSTVVKSPVFILGCGRSGTTILGNTLWHHEQLLYLNEPRRIWFNDPKTDIWGSDAASSNGQLRLIADDNIPTLTDKIRLDFSTELKLNKQHQLVEKLPINSFRIPYLKSIFPDARFIHMIRNGVEVSRSIATLYAKTGQWFGKDGYKWNLLAEYAASRQEENLVKLCADNSVLKGALEWYLSVSTIGQDLKHLPDESYIEVRYEDLLSDPLDVCQSLETFIGLDYSEQMHEFAKTKIRRKTPKPGNHDMSDEMMQIAGGLLQQLGYLSTC